jgi:Alternate to MurJ
MDIQLFILCALTFVIHLIGTLAYAVRIAGVRTRRIAVCFALFNILVLVSRTSNSFQGPFLAKRIEENIALGVSHSLLTDFRWLLLSATLATLIGAFLIPTFQRVFSLAVKHFQVHRSLPRLLMHGFFKGGLGYVQQSVSLPSSGNVRSLKIEKVISPWVLIFNTLAVALWTIGVFAALYAGALNPALRVTASTLSSVINGVATILMFAFIDPHLSVMTDDVIEGQTSESTFRKTIVWLVGSRLAGTLLGQALLVPSAMAIAAIAAAM